MIIETAERLNNIEEYYFSKKLREIREMQEEGKDVINLGIGNPDMPPPPAATRELGAVAERADVHGYQNHRGIPELRGAVSEWLGRMFGITPDPDARILPLMGSKEGIMHLSMAFLDPGDEVLVPDPGYPTYSTATRLAGGAPRPYALKAENGWQPDLEELRNADLSGVKLMWLNYPHMPTGAKPDRAALASLVELAKENGFLLCHDNPYAFILNEDPLSLFNIPGAHEVGVELHSMSKTFNMAGWRIGWMISAPDILEAVIKVKTNMDSGMFLGLQKAAIQALSEGQDRLRELNERYRERREMVGKLLRTIDVPFDDDQASLFVWGKVRTHADGFALSESLLREAHVFVAPGGIFGQEGEAYIRVSLCAPQDRIEEALERSKKLSGNKGSIARGKAEEKSLKEQRER